MLRERESGMNGGRKTKKKDNAVGEKEKDGERIKNGQMQQLAF